MIFVSPFQLWRSEKLRADAAESKLVPSANWEIGYPESRQSGNWTISVINRGPIDTADHVSLYLNDIVPRPKDQNWNPHYPVASQIRGRGSDTSTTAPKDIPILFEFVCVLGVTSGRVIPIRHLDPHSRDLLFDPDEHFLDLHYSLTSHHSRSKPEAFVVRLTRAGDEISVKKINAY
jgi:hypothetical protein